MRVIFIKAAYRVQLTCTIPISNKDLFDKFTKQRHKINKEETRCHSSCMTENKSSTESDPKLIIMIVVAISVPQNILNKIES